MTVDDRQDDDFLAGVATLRTCDVSPRHAHRLRRRCHALLQTQQPRARRSDEMEEWTAFRRLIVPTLGGAWCLAYLMEIVRLVAAVHGSP